MSVSVSARRRVSAGDLDGVVRVLCRALMASLLRTHRSKFTQFVLFFACAKDSSLKASVTFTNGLVRPSSHDVCCFLQPIMRFVV